MTLPLGPSGSRAAPRSGECGSSWGPIGTLGTPQSVPHLEFLARHPEFCDIAPDGVTSDGRSPDLTGSPWNGLIEGVDPDQRSLSWPEGSGSAPSRSLPRCARVRCRSLKERAWRSPARRAHCLQVSCFAVPCPSAPTATKVAEGGQVGAAQALGSVLDGLDRSRGSCPACAGRFRGRGKRRAGPCCGSALCGRQQLCRPPYPRLRGPTLPP